MGEIFKFKYMFCMLCKTNMLNAFQNKSNVLSQKDYLTVQRPKHNKVIITKMKCLVGHLGHLFHKKLRLENPQPIEEVRMGRGQMSFRITIFLLTIVSWKAHHIGVLQDLCGITKLGLSFRSLQPTFYETFATRHPMETSNSKMS